MTISVIQFVSAASVIVFAGLFLTRFADRIADLTGWGRLFVGGLLLAGATSLPELMVDIHAVKSGLPDLAVGDLLGSCLFNLLILSILDFAYPSAFRGTAFSPKFLHHALSAVLSMVLVSVVGVAMASKLSSTFLGASWFSWILIGVYLVGLKMVFSEGREDSRDPVDAPAPENKTRDLVLAFGGYFACTVVILLAAPYLVEAADRIAESSGLGHGFIGTTLVAFATSLPELVATLAAFRMGAPDLALGNIFGSNAFNLVLFLPLDLLQSGSLYVALTGNHAISVFGIVTATGVAVLGQLYRKKERSRFSEPSSETVVVVILAYLLLLYGLKG